MASASHSHLLIVEEKVPGEHSGLVLAGRKDISGCDYTSPLLFVFCFLHIHRKWPEGGKSV